MVIFNFCDNWTKWLWTLQSLPEFLVLVLLPANSQHFPCALLSLLMHLQILLLLVLCCLIAVSYAAALAFLRGVLFLYSCPQTHACVSPFVSLPFDSETLVDIWMQLQRPLATLSAVPPHQDRLTFNNESFTKQRHPPLLSPSQYFHQKPQHQLSFWCCSFLFFRKVHRIIPQSARWKSCHLSWSQAVALPSAPHSGLNLNHPGWQHYLLTSTNPSGIIRFLSAVIYLGTRMGKAQHIAAG